MTDFPLTPADVAALRVLLARAKAAGFSRHFVYKFAGGAPEHVWFTKGRDRIRLYEGQMTLFVWQGDRLSGSCREWSVPVVSVAQVAAVLEMVGALPPVDNTALIRRAIADPAKFTARRQIDTEEVYGLTVYEHLDDWQARAAVIALASADARSDAA